jgi:hypothetical protein
VGAPAKVKVGELAEGVLNLEEASEFAVEGNNADATCCRNEI